MKKILFISLLCISAFFANSQQLLINKYLKDTLVGSGWQIWHDSLHNGIFYQLAGSSGGGSINISNTALTADGNYEHDWNLKTLHIKNIDDLFLRNDETELANNHFKLGPYSLGLGSYLAAGEGDADITMGWGFDDLARRYVRTDLNAATGSNTSRIRIYGDSIQWMHHEASDPSGDFDYNRLIYSVKHKLYFNGDSLYSNNLFHASSANDSVVVWNPTTKRFGYKSVSGITPGSIVNADINASAAIDISKTALALTTTGSSGAATLVGNTLNIPQYGGGSAFANYAVAYLDTLGDDGTAIIGRPDKPFATINAALDALPSTGGVLQFMSPTRFAKPDSLKFKDNLWFKGMGQPRTNMTQTTTDMSFANTVASPTKLVGGTVILGGMAFINKNNIVISDLGIDVGVEYAAAGGNISHDCLSFYSVSSNLDEPPYALNTGISIYNVTTLNYSSSTPHHGIVIQDAYQPKVHNINTNFGFAGFVAKTDGGTFESVTARGHSTYGIILKTDRYSYGHDMILNGFEITSIASLDGAGLYLDNSDLLTPGLSYLNISNGVIRGTTFGIANNGVNPGSNTLVSSVTIRNVSGDGIAIVGGQQLLTISNCDVSYSGGDGVKVSGVVLADISNTTSSLNTGDGFDLNGSSAANRITINGCKSYLNDVGLRSGGNVFVNGFSVGNNTSASFAGTAVVGDYQDAAYTATTNYGVFNNLNVNGNGYVNGFITTSSSAAGANFIFTSGVSQFTVGVRDDFASGTFAIVDNIAALSRVQINNAGAVRFNAYGAGTLVTDGSGNITASSDERLKNIKGEYKAGLLEVMGVNPILYSWNEKSGLETKGTYAGFSAQNVKANIPFGTGQNTDGTLTLQDRAVLAAAINAIKELNIKVEKLEKQLKEK